jgi:hypothetical protein
LSGILMTNASQVRDSESVHIVRENTMNSAGLTPA